jgi:hypothetical protein
VFRYQQRALKFVFSSGIVSRYDAQVMFSNVISAQIQSNFEPRPEAMLPIRKGRFDIPSHAMGPGTCCDVITVDKYLDLFDQADFRRKPTANGPFARLKFDSVPVLETIRTSVGNVKISAEARIVSLIGVRLDTSNCLLVEPARLTSKEPLVIPAEKRFSGNKLNIEEFSPVFEDPPIGMINDRPPFIPGPIFIQDQHPRIFFVELPSRCVLIRDTIVKCGHESAAGF